MEPIGQLVGEAKRGLGRCQFETTSEPATFIVRVSGMDGPLLLKRALAEAEAFGADQTSGWVWITDARKLVWTSPRSPLLLKKVRNLPNNRGYAVIAGQPFRSIGKLMGHLYGAQRFVATPAEALQFAGEQL